MLHSSMLTCGIVAGVSLAIAPTADAQVALNVDFDADTPGLPPLTDPAGDPPGDFLVLEDEAGTITVEASIGTLVDQPVLLAKTSEGALSLEGFLDPLYTTCGRYTIRWQSLAHSVQFFFQVAMYGESEVLASLEYRANGAFSFNGFANVISPTWELDVHQTFIVTLDFDTGVTALAIDDVRVQVSGLDLTDDIFDRVLVVAGSEPGVELAIDDITVTASNCLTPAEEVGWGRIKALF